MLLLAVPAMAGPPPEQDFEERVPTSLNRDAQGFGLGVMLGLPTGLSAAVRPKSGPVWFDAGLAWSFVADTLDTHADVLVSVYDARTDELPDVSFPLFVGVGPRLHVGDDPTDLSPALVQVGLRVPIGMAVIHDGFPLEGWLELVPGVGLAPTTQAFFEAAVGARFYFGKKAAEPTTTPPKQTLIEG